MFLQCSSGKRKKGTKVREGGKEREMGCRIRSEFNFGKWRWEGGGKKPGELINKTEGKKGTGSANFCPSSGMR